MKRDLGQRGSSFGAMRKIENRKGRQCVFVINPQAGLSETFFLKFNYVANLISRWFSKRLGYSHFVDMSSGKKSGVYAAAPHPQPLKDHRERRAMQNAGRRYPVFIEPIFRHPRQMTSAGSIQPSTGQVLVKCRTMLDRRFYASKIFLETRTPMMFTMAFFNDHGFFFFVTWTNSTKV